MFCIDRPLDIHSVEIKETVETKPEDVGEDSVGGVTWDEPTIAEHDKERGTRTKITEPKTPYNHEHGTFSSDDDASMEIEHLGTSPRKHSPRFNLPPSPKKHTAHADHQKAHSASEDACTGQSPSESFKMEPGNRKIRAQAPSAIDPESLQRRVEDVKQERSQEDKRHQMNTDQDQESEESEDEEEFLTPQERAKKSAFAEKRKQHYDEFKRMKELLGGQKGDDDDSSSESE